MRKSWGPSPPQVKISLKGHLGHIHCWSNPRNEDQQCQSQPSYFLKGDGWDSDLHWLQGRFTTPSFHEGPGDVDIWYAHHLLGSNSLLRVVGKTTGLRKSCFFTHPLLISTAAPSGDSDGGLAVGSYIKHKSTINRNKINTYKINKLNNTNHIIIPWAIHVLKIIYL